MDILYASWVGQPVWMWLSFLSLVAVLLTFDLFSNRNRIMGIKESLLLSAFYFTISVIFGAFVWWGYENGHIITSDGTHAGITYFTGFFIEKALSIDNVFVISMIFTYFAIPSAYQYRALLWGILAVLILRGIMIAIGAALIQEYAWILYIFGAFLIATGIKMLLVSEKEHDISKNALIIFLKKHLNVTDTLHGQKFFVRQENSQGKIVLWITPLFLSLIVINIADLIFAVDSVPAIFAITTDTFIVYTANIMAILGLRALYFALSAMVERFSYLKYSLALVLVFIGGKIFWNQIFGKVDPIISLSVTITMILGGIFFSLWKTRQT